MNQQAEAQPRNWLELPAVVMSMILLKLAPLKSLPALKTSARPGVRSARIPLMWRVIDMQGLSDSHWMKYNLEVMCKHDVNHSCGQLVEINIEYFGTDKLLQYISQSSNQEVSGFYIAIAFLSRPSLKQFQNFHCWSILN
ncbi:unnamed protein product [Citrullus colocynthis]|uniref:Uncharacterized protein n=1 Tax=Citrullus colocynthis TaxID=252529 RepID=A0ABP0YLJ5_9ROSI